MPAEFRPARADDANAAVPLIYASGPEAFNYVFGPTNKGGALAYLRAAFRDGAGEFGYRNHVVGVRAGEVVAAGAGWSSATTLPFTMAAARQFFTQFGPFAAIGAIARGLATERVVRPPVATEFCIGHLGVRDDLRGMGLGGALMAYLLALGHAQNLATAVLDVAITNPRAEGLYTRMGYRVQVERQADLHNKFGRVVAHRRMARPLTI